MKRLRSKFIIAFVLLFGITIFLSCEKSIDYNSQDMQKDNQLKSEETVRFIMNENNPFDVYGENIKGFYVELNEILKNEKYKDRDLYDKVLKDLSNKYGNVYPVIDTLGYSDSESKYIVDLVKLQDELQDIRLSSKIIEEKVIEDESINKIQKNRLLSVISQYKYNQFYTEEILMYSWEGDFNNCMNNQLGAIFADDGNPVPETLFIIGLPESFFSVEAICIYEATFLS